VHPVVASFVMGSVHPVVASCVMGSVHPVVASCVMGSVDPVVASFVMGSLDPVVASCVMCPVHPVGRHGPIQNQQSIHVHRAVSLRGNVAYCKIRRAIVSLNAKILK